MKRFGGVPASPSGLLPRVTITHSLLCFLLELLYVYVYKSLFKRTFLYPFLKRVYYKDHFCQYEMDNPPFFKQLYRVYSFKTPLPYLPFLKHPYYHSSCFWIPHFAYLTLLPLGVSSVVLGLVGLFYFLKSLGKRADT